MAATICYTILYFIFSYIFEDNMSTNCDINLPYHKSVLPYKVFLTYKISNNIQLLRI